MRHNNSGPNCTRQWCIRWKRNWNRKMERKWGSLHRGKGKCCWGWKVENNMPVQQQLIWSAAANHWGSQHFTLIFCLSNNFLQNSAIDLQSTLRALGPKHAPDYIRDVGSILMMKSQMVTIIFSLEDEESKIFKRESEISTHPTTAQFFFALFHLK